MWLLLLFTIRAWLVLLMVLAVWTMLLLCLIGLDVCRSMLLFDGFGVVVLLL
jgi:hypothetical protein